MIDRHLDDRVLDVRVLDGRFLDGRFLDGRFLELDLDVADTRDVGTRDAMTAFWCTRGLRLRSRSRRARLARVEDPSQLGPPLLGQQRSAPTRVRWDRGLGLVVETVEVELRLIAIGRRRLAGRQIAGTVG